LPEPDSGEITKYGGSVIDRAMGCKVTKALQIETAWRRGP
jgi:hypothetical protein